MCKNMHAKLVLTLFDVAILLDVSQLTFENVLNTTGNILPIIKTQIEDMRRFTLWQLCSSDAKHETTIDLLHIDLISIAFSKQLTSWPRINYHIKNKQARGGGKANIAGRT